MFQTHNENHFNVLRLFLTYDSTRKPVTTPVILHVFLEAQTCSVQRAIYLSLVLVDIFRRNTDLEALHAIEANF